MGGGHTLWRSARTVLVVAVFAVTAGTATVLPQAAFGEERSCRGKVGRLTLDNVRVSQGATCILRGTRVKGSVTVQRDATLVANGVHVTGNVQAENARNVVVRRSSRVGGSIQLHQGGRATIRASRVNGDVNADENRGYLRLLGNRVGGSVQVVGNTGGASIAGNVIDGNLHCKENRPPPTGRRNVVRESKLDQCTRL
jgi:hypothetical protein